jgi:spore maturation protein CgeB
MTLDIVFLGLSITSSWGNGHATTYRGLIRELARRGHRITFLERDVPWYATARDQPEPDGCTTVLYASLEELKDRFAETVRTADAVIVGSYVPDGIAVGDWVLETAEGLAAFYDIDTPITLAGLEEGGTAYLAPRQIAAYGLYLSFTGGPTLQRLERQFGSPLARPLYCSADPELHAPMEVESRFALGYLGTYSPDRQPPLEALLLEPARRRPGERFAVAGAQYPDDIAWPGNVERIDHLPPDRHRAFYSAQRFTLNVTRADMVRAGWSPSVRLFEAAACGTPIISDFWQGLDELFQPGREILVARSPADVVRALESHSPEEARAMGARARDRVLAAHTAAHRAGELEADLLLALSRRRRATPAVAGRRRRA